MKRKRINHQVDIFCDMFAGWKIINDLETLIQLESGNLDLDLLSNSVFFNGQDFEKPLYIVEEISEWFTNDLEQAGISKDFIKEARLDVLFTTKTRSNKPISRTRKIVEVKLDLSATIITEEAEYKTTKNKVSEYNYIEK